MEPKTYTNSCGLVFDSQEELEAWDAYVEERLAKARQTPVISHEEAKEEIRLLREGLRHVPYTVE